MYIFRLLRRERVRDNLRAHASRVRENVVPALQNEVLGPLRRSHAPFLMLAASLTHQQGPAVVFLLERILTGCQKQYFPCQANGTPRKHGNSRKVAKTRHFIAFLRYFEHLLGAFWPALQPRFCVSGCNKGKFLKPKQRVRAICCKFQGGFHDYQFMAPHSSHHLQIAMFYQWLIKKQSLSWVWATYRVSWWPKRKEFPMEIQIKHHV